MEGQSTRSPTVACVGGLDPSGCAGLAADLRAVAAHGLHGAPVASVLTVQDTRAVHRVEGVASELVAAQLTAVLADLDVRALKLGLLGPVANIEAIARLLPALPYVVDPVLAASTGGVLTSDDARAALRTALLPRATLLTPNAPEAAALTGLEVTSPDEAVAAASVLRAWGASAVLVKGGHFSARRGTDVLVTDAGVTLLEGQPLDVSDTRGTGCTLASSIAARLARGETLADAVAGARAFVRAALLLGRRVGAGPGPVGATRARVGRLHVLVPTAGLAAHAVAGGADVVQLREKGSLPTSAWVELARGVRAACGAVSMVVNDRVDVAAATGVGAHVGREDLDPLVARRLLGSTPLLGATANNLEEALAVWEKAGGALDYLGVGPVHATESKANPAPVLGYDGLSRIAAAVPLPIIAIGGLTPERVSACLDAGAHGVAVLSAVTGAPDPRAATAAFRAAVDACGHT